jgi:hypothetical protein
MASAVDICNLALSHIGDTADVSSISPPEGSAQADHCAKFYPIARDSLLSMHCWSFATKRALLVQVENPYSQWNYAYSLPSDLMSIISILPSDATSDYSMAFSPADNILWNINSSPGNAVTGYTPQAYALEIDSVGNDVLYTNQADAMIKYTKYTTDTSKFSPNFTVALSHLLASYLAGPVIKGDVGIKVSTEQLKIAMGYVSKAREDDSGHGKNVISHIVPWSAGR